MQLTIRYLNCRQPLVIDVDPWDTIGTLKDKVHAQDETLHPDRSMLIYKSQRLLDDNETIEGLEISTDDKMLVLPTLPAEGNITD